MSKRTSADSFDKLLLLLGVVNEHIAHKLKVFEHARQSRSVAFTCRYYGISKDTFYRWKKQYTAIDEKHTQQNAIDFIN